MADPDTSALLTLVLLKAVEVIGIALLTLVLLMAVEVIGIALWGLMKGETK